MLKRLIKHLVETFRSEDTVLFTPDPRFMHRRRKPFIFLILCMGAGSLSAQTNLPTSYYWGSQISTDGGITWVSDRTSPDTLIPTEQVDSTYLSLRTEGWQWMDGERLVSYNSRDWALGTKIECSCPYRHVLTRQVFKRVPRQGLTR